MKDIVIKQNSWNILKLTLGGLFFSILLIIMLLYVIDHYNDIGFQTTKLLRHKNFSIPLLIIGIILSGGLTIYLTFRLFNVRHALIIKKDGFIDYSTISAVGFISWASVKSISILTIGFQNFIIVDVKSINNLLKPLRRYKQHIVKMTIKLGFPPVAINLNSIKEKPEEIVVIMNKYLDEWRKNDL